MQPSFVELVLIFGSELTSESLNSSLGEMPCNIVVQKKASFGKLFDFNCPTYTNTRVNKYKGLNTITCRAKESKLRQTC